EDGNLAAFWFDNNMLFSARYLSGAWAQPVMLAMADGNPPEFSIDGDGNVSVVYTNMSMVTLRRVAKTGTAWTDPVVVNMGDTGQETGPAGVGHDASNNPVVMYVMVTQGPMGNMLHLQARTCH